MPDQDPVVQPNPDPVQGGGDPEPSIRTDDKAIEVKAREIAERIAAKRTEEITRENKKLTNDMEELRTAGLSDQQKALEDAEKRGAEKAATEYEVKLRQATIEKRLAKHLDGDALELAAEMAASIQGEPDEVMERLQKAMPKLFETKPIGGGGGRNPDLEEAPDYSDPEVLSEKLRSLTNEDDRVAFWKKHGKDIERKQTEAVGGARTWAPGEGLTEFHPTNEAVQRKR